MDNMYFDFAKTVKQKLCNDINGKIFFEIYSRIDTIIFKVSFKDFDFSYPIKEVQDYIYSGNSADDVVENFKTEYMKTIKKTFFKSENHKRRDEMAKIGVEL